MNPTSTAARQLIGQYLQALSGQRKTPDLVAEFVSDPHLAAHIRDVEAAFPEYELIADDLIAERDLVAMRGTFRVSIEACSLAYRPRARVCLLR
jgi:predicted ester cyclase